MIVVAGGPARHPGDRSTPPDRLTPVLALRGASLVPVEGFVPVEGRGVSNMAAVGDEVWWTSGADLLRGPHGVPVLPGPWVDVHELTVDGDQLLMANSGQEEVVVVDTSGSAPAEKGRDRIAEGILHLNQVFVGLDGHRYGLVHHVGGRQLTRRIAGRLLKQQGDGGVIRLDDGHRVPLRLTAPHSARRVGDEMWVADSGRSRVVRYDVEWNVTGSFPVAGWGRGACVIDSVYWIGLSPLRPRYRGFVEGRAVTAPELQAIDIESRTVVDRFELDGIDQVNGVHEFRPGQVEFPP